MELNHVGPVKYALLLSAALLGSALTASATTDDWSATCEDDLCLFRKTVSSPDGTGASALFEILIDTENGDASVVVTAPLGIAVEPGVRLITEGREWRANVRVCEAEGCRAIVKLNAEDLGIFLQRPDLEMQFYVFGNNDPTRLSLPVRGLVAAMTSQRN